MYQRCLEPEILRQSEAYYEAEAERLLETCDGLEYLSRVSSLYELPSWLVILPFARLVRLKHASQWKSGAFANVYRCRLWLLFGLFLKKPSSQCPGKDSLT
jgi:hypothetical protein